MSSQFDDGDYDCVKHQVGKTCFYIRLLGLFKPRCIKYGVKGGIIGYRRRDVIKVQKERHVICLKCGHFGVLALQKHVKLPGICQRCWKQEEKAAGSNDPGSFLGASKGS